MATLPFFNLENLFTPQQSTHKSGFPMNFPQILLQIPPMIRWSHNPSPFIFQFWLCTCVHMCIYLFILKNLPSSSSTQFFVAKFLECFQEAIKPVTFPLPSHMTAIFWSSLDFSYEIMAANLEEVVANFLMGKGNKGHWPSQSPITRHLHKCLIPCKAVTGTPTLSTHFFICSCAPC